MLAGGTPGAGTCPVGFTGYYGYLRALSMYAVNDQYLLESTFGASSIKCHGSECGATGNWGELHMFVCCK